MDSNQNELWNQQFFSCFFFVYLVFIDFVFHNFIRFSLFFHLSLNIYSTHKKYLIIVKWYWWFNAIWNAILVKVLTIVTNVGLMFIQLFYASTYILLKMVKFVYKLFSRQCFHTIQTTQIAEKMWIQIVIEVSLLKILLTESNFLYQWLIP